MQCKKILLIEDAAADVRSVRDALAGSKYGGFQIETVSSCAAGLERLLGTSPHSSADAIVAVVVDLFLPDVQGIETFLSLQRAAPQIPMLVLCTQQTEDLAKIAVHHGAQDYLLKEQLNSYLLPKALDSMIERAVVSVALFEEKERARVTLDSIGDAVISSDLVGRVTYLNTIAEVMTGWTLGAAAGHPVEEVLQLVDATTRETVGSPLAAALRDNRTVGLTANCLQIGRGGNEAFIEDSAAPIHDRRGQMTGAVMVFHDVSVIRALSRRNSFLAQHDSLTGLPNRTLLDDRLRQALALAHRHPEKRLAVLFVDVDGFKRINDTLGHAVGDLLLQSVAQRLLACVRKSDTVSRQGGDEFVVLLGEVGHAKDAAAVAEKMLQALRAPHTAEGHLLHLTASIGISTFPEDGVEADVLMNNADLAMFHAKASGRDNYQFFKADLTARAVKRQDLETGLHRALELQELLLHYQPQIDLDTGAIGAIEALPRWFHPQLGLLLPDQFKSIAEDSGVLAQIGRWVLAEASSQARIWKEGGLAPVVIALNVSIQELRSKNFLSNVRHVLDLSEVQPQQLEFEITEAVMMDDSKVASAVLSALKAMGVRIALADFGTGYSSLRYLRRLPIDVLKIDRSFVADLAIDDDNARIVSAMVNMGRSLGIRVVAEGVETSEQCAWLRKNGCPAGQGTYFSKPLSALDMMRRLQGELAGRRRRKAREAWDSDDRATQALPKLKSRARVR